MILDLCGLQNKYNEQIQNEEMFELKKNLTEIRALLKKYRDQPMDLADAAVVRMSELFEHCLVYTVDRKDFSVYRRHSRKPIPCVFPA